MARTYNDTDDISILFNDIAKELGIDPTSLDPAQNLLNQSVITKKIGGLRTLSKEAWLRKGLEEALYDKIMTNLKGGAIAEASIVDLLTKENSKLTQLYNTEIRKNILLVQSNNSVFFFKRARSNGCINNWDLKDLESIPDINEIWQNVKAAIPAPMPVDTAEEKVRPLLKQVLCIPASRFDYNIWEEKVVQRMSSQHYPDFAFISKSAPLPDTAIDWSKFLVIIELQKRIVPKERSTIKSEWKAEYNPLILSTFSGFDDGLGQTMSWMNDYPYNKSYCVITDYRWWTFMNAERINGIWSFNISNIVPIVDYKEPNNIQDSNESPFAFKSLMKLAKAAKQI